MARIQDPPSALSELQLKRQRQEKEDLITHLDNLLERYLHTLDEYEKVQQQLSKQLSSGYLSLAQANFHNSSSAFRYGQDCYDERMQAIRKFAITDKTSSAGTRSFFSIFPEQRNHENAEKSGDIINSKKQASQEDTQESSTLTDSTSETTTSATSASDAKDNTGSNHNPDGEKASSSSATKRSDPLRWFGILVPPALRTAQSTFIGVVEGPVPQLATIARDLRNQEVEIGRLRKHLKRL